MLLLKIIREVDERGKMQKITTSKLAPSAPTKENFQNVERCHWFSACWLLNDKIAWMEYMVQSKEKKCRGQYIPIWWRRNPRGIMNVSCLKIW